MFRMISNLCVLFRFHFETSHHNHVTDSDLILIWPVFAYEVTWSCDILYITSL
jgi:hypothetical protein